MPSVADLALRVDATDVKKANVQLDKLAKTSESTEKSVKKFSDNSSKSLAFLKTGVAGVASAFAAIGGAQIVRSLTDASLSMERFTNSLTAATGSSTAASKELSFVREETNRLGLNLESAAGQYSKLAAAARGTVLEGRAAREIFTSISEASTVLGLSAEETGGALTAIEQIISKGTVSAEELRGQLGERLPGAFQIAARAMNVTTQELGEMLQRGEVLAEDLLPALAKELNVTFGDQVETAASGLNAQINRMETGFFDLRVAIGEAGVSEFFKEAAGTSANFFSTFSSAIRIAITDTTNFDTALSEADKSLKVLTDQEKMKQWGDQVARTAAFAVDGIRSVGIVFDLVGKAIGATIARIESLLKGDFAGSRSIGKAFTQDFDEALASFGKMQDAVEAQILIRDNLATATNITTDSLNENSDALNRNAESSGKASKGLSDAEKEMKKMRQEVERLTLAHDPLARMNSELADLVMLRDRAGLQDEIFDRAATESINRYIDSLQDVTKETKEVDKVTNELSDTSVRVFDEISQFSLQAARNIQTSLSDALLDSTKGFESFAKNVLNIFKRMAAEIASVKILEGFGVDRLLGGGGRSGGLGGSGGGFLNTASLLSSGANLFSTGLGTTGLIGSGIGALGSALGSGTLSAFGGAFAGGSSAAGVSAALLNGTASSAAAASGAAGIGASIGAVAGPAIALAVVDQIGRLLAGNKSTGTFADKIPVIGGFAGALFGRGPLKQKDSLVRGTITEQGIGEDFLGATNFKAKGGLLRGDKVDRVIINANTGELVNGAPGLPESGISKELLPFAADLAPQIVGIGQVFDQAIKGFDTSLRATGETLGIGSSQLDNFQRWIQLTATSAEGITGEQVAEEIQNIGDHMANVLLPGLQNMRKGNETATQALSRLVSEFNSLDNALQILGVSSSDAEAAVKGLSITQRTQLVDSAGGLEAFNAQMAFFANNFLTAEQQLELSFNALDEEMQKLGFSASISRDEFTNLVKSVTQVGGITTETAAALLKLAPAFDQVKNAEAALAAQNSTTESSLDGLTSSVGNLGNEAAEAAAKIAQTVQDSFARIDNARNALDAAEKQLAVSRAQRGVNEATQRAQIADSALAKAQSDLERARNAALSRQANNISDEIDAIGAAIAVRGELISNYQQEAAALRGVVDRFGALSQKIVDFRDSLALGELSPFSPGEQLAIARQQFNQTRNLAAQGDEGALSRLPEVSKTFLEASKTFNGATGAFESDFNFVQQVLESSGATARAARDIASEQLAGIESQITELELINKAEQDQIKALNDVASTLGNVDENVLSVEQALKNLASAEQDKLIADQQVRDANRVLEAEMFKQNGFIDEVGRNTLLVRDSVNELRDAVLQGFGNAAISDQQIRDFVISNQGQSDKFFADAAVSAGISGNQLKRALAPLGVSSERINASTGGGALRDSDISSVVDQKLASGDFMGIYNLARANGVSSQRLADASVLSKTEIDAFVRANNLQPFRSGTDFVQKDGIAMLHKGESVIPSSATRELKALRIELNELRKEQNRQMTALINTNIQANKENAQVIAKSNERLSANENWRNRSRAVVK